MSDQASVNRTRALLDFAIVVEKNSNYSAYNENHLRFFAPPDATGAYDQIHLFQVIYAPPGEEPYIISIGSSNGNSYGNGTAAEVRLFNHEHENDMQVSHGHSYVDVGDNGNRYNQVQEGFYEGASDSAGAGGVNASDNTQKSPSSSFSSSSSPVAAQTSTRKRLFLNSSQGSGSVNVEQEQKEGCRKEDNLASRGSAKTQPTIVNGNDDVDQWHEAGIVGRGRSRGRQTGVDAATTTAKIGSVNSYSQDKDKDEQSASQSKRSRMTRSAVIDIDIDIDAIASEGASGDARQTRTRTRSRSDSLSQHQQQEEEEEESIPPPSHQSKNKGMAKNKGGNGSQQTGTGTGASKTRRGVSPSPSLSVSPIASQKQEESDDDDAEEATMREGQEQELRSLSQISQEQSSLIHAPLSPELSPSPSHIHSPVFSQSHSRGRARAGSGSGSPSASQMQEHEQALPSPLHSSASGASFNVYDVGDVIEHSQSQSQHSQSMKEMSGIRNGNGSTSGSAEKFKFCWQATEGPEAETEALDATAESSPSLLLSTATTSTATTTVTMQQLLQMQMQTWPIVVQSRASVIWQPPVKTTTGTGIDIGVDILNRCVVYWCTSTLRCISNLALDTARSTAAALSIPLVVLVTLDTVVVRKAMLEVMVDVQQTDADTDADTDVDADNASSSSSSIGNVFKTPAAQRYRESSSSSSSTSRKQNSHMFSLGSATATAVPTTQGVGKTTTRTTFSERSQSRLPSAGTATDTAAATGPTWLTSQMKAQAHCAAAACFRQEVYALYPNAVVVGYVPGADAYGDSHSTNGNDCAVPIPSPIPIESLCQFGLSTSNSHSHGNGDGNDDSNGDAKGTFKPPTLTPLFVFTDDVVTPSQRCAVLRMAQGLSLSSSSPSSTSSGDFVVIAVDSDSLCLSGAPDAGTGVPSSSSSSLSSSLSVQGWEEHIRRVRRDMQTLTVSHKTQTQIQVERQKLATTKSPTVVPINGPVPVPVFIPVSVPIPAPKGIVSASLWRTWASFTPAWPRTMPLLFPCMPPSVSVSSVNDPHYGNCHSSSSSNSHFPDENCWLHLLAGMELPWLQSVVPPERLIQCLPVSLFQRTGTDTDTAATTDREREKDMEWDGVFSHLCLVDYCKHVCRNWLRTLPTQSLLPGSLVQDDTHVPWMDLCPALVPLLKTAVTMSSKASASASTLSLTLPYPADICQGRTSDKLFNALQLALFLRGISPKHLAAQYWVGYLLVHMPTPEIGLQIAILEQSRHSIGLHADNLPALVFPLLLAAVTFLTNANEVRGVEGGEGTGMMAQLRRTEEGIKLKVGTLSYDRLCCSFS